MIGNLFMRFYVETYGCSLNQGETELLKRRALRRGWSRTEDMQGADLLILSTCVVIQATEARMFTRLRRMASTGKPLLVYGCMAEALRQRIEEIAPKAWLLGPSSWKGIDEVLRKYDGGTLRGACEEPEGLRGDEAPVSSIHADIPIANGCTGKCTYCITRLARGGLESRPVQEILDQVREELSMGRREIRLTAQDSGLYGRDLDRTTGLADLVRLVTEIEDDFRIRIGMMNPNSLKPMIDGLMRAYVHPKVYGFLHLPVQSGSDRVLSIMGRRYSVEDFEGLVKTFRHGIPETCLSTDVIAGFPTESDEEFRETCRLLKRVGPEIVNIKAYSARPGTSAKVMDGRVDTATVKDRTRVLTDLTRRISKERLAARQGEETDIFLTKRVRRGSTMGRDRAYIPVVVDGEHPLGICRRVRITSSTDNHLIADLVK